MATDPAFAATPHVGAVTVPATLDTSLTAPSNVATVLSGGASGTKVDTVTVQALGTTALGVLNLFLYDGSTYHLFDQIVVVAVTSSTTAVGFEQTRSYPALIVPNGWSLRCTVTVSGLQSLLKVIAFGGDF